MDIDQIIHDEVGFVPSRVDKTKEKPGPYRPNPVYAPSEQSTLTDNGFTDWPVYENKPLLAEVDAAMGKLSPGERLARRLRADKRTA